MKLASYKARRPGVFGIFNDVTKWWLNGSYSHSELVFSSGISGSCSLMDRGVRLKQIDFNPDHWDFVTINGFDEDSAFKWFVDHEGERYSIRKLIRSVADYQGGGANNSHICSSAIMAALGFPEPWRFDPCSTHAILMHCHGPHKIIRRIGD
jgi:hypothetical protein